MGAQAVERVAGKKFPAMERSLDVREGDELPFGNSMDVDKGRQELPDIPAVEYLSNFLGFRRKVHGSDGGDRRRASSGEETALSPDRGPRP